MHEINEKDFALLCYNVFVDRYQSKAIAYMREKAGMLENGWEAFGSLDHYKMQRVIDYCKAWKLYLPNKITKRYEKEAKAAGELGL